MDHEKSEGSGGSSMGRSFLQKLPLKRLSSSELPDGKRRNTWASGAPFRANVLPLTTNNLFRECNEKLATLAQNQRQIVEWTTLIGEFEQVKNDYLAKNQLEEFKLNLYIPVEGMADPHDSNRFDLLEAVQTFLSDAVSQKVCFTLI
ncbi:hypothetical protein BDZ91DRAFT_327816 [Kalaharituber pfeilii]|nr:hypothetical protein BDZ91DRAFT_327816 [Kalaharituber pfeilii]